MADQELVVKFKGDTSDIDKAFAKVKGQLNDMPNASRKAADGLDKFDKSTRSTTSSLSDYAKAYLSVTAVMAAGKVFIDATAQVQKFESQLKVASGTQANYAKNTAFLQNLAEKYNKNVIDLAGNFAKLTIATKGTNLEGAKTERLFAAVTATSAALQMSVDDTNGTFNAFIQMVSKGNVQAEELRGQLGERLYGAFNLAAKSMGVTTQELNKMLQNGEVLAEDLLPRLTVELERTFGKTAEENAQNLGSAIAYASGQLTLFLAEFAKNTGFTDWITDQVKGAGKLASQLRILSKEQGTMAAIGGAAGALLEDGLKTYGYKSPALEYARKAQYIRSYDPNLQSFPGEIKSNQNYYLGSGSAESAPANPAAEERARKAAEKAANKAAAAVNKWVAEEIRKSQDRIAEGLLNNEIANDAAFRTNNGFINPVGAKLPTGLTNTYTMSGDKTGQSFTNGATGDGSASNYDRIIANMDNAISEAQKRYNTMNQTTDQFAQQLDNSMQNAFGSAITASVEGIGNLVGGLVNGTATLADVGNVFLGIMAGLFDNIGKALASYAATILIADAAIGSLNPVGALVGAALAFAAAGLARSQMQSAGEQAFWTGGIVQGRGGVDNVHTALSPGEMVLNGSQQNRLWGIVSGANSGREFSSNFGSNAGNDDIAVSVYGRLKGTDIDISGTKGKRKNNYFR